VERHEKARKCTTCYRNHVKKGEGILTDGERGLRKSGSYFISRACGRGGRGGGTANSYPQKGGKASDQHAAQGPREL